MRLAILVLSLILCSPQVMSILHLTVMQTNLAQVKESRAWICIEHDDTRITILQTVFNAIMTVCMYRYVAMARSCDSQITCQLPLTDSLKRTRCSPQRCWHWRGCHSGRVAAVLGEEDHRNSVGSLTNMWVGLSHHIKNSGPTRSHTQQSA